MTAVAGGRNVSLPLTWSGEVPGVASYAVVMIDRHPAARSWVHWALVDLPPSITAVEEGASPNVVAPARELTNTFGSAGYGGPQPPRGSGDHTYAITVYALDVARLDIPEAPTAREIDAAVEGHTLAYGTLTGVVGR